MAHDCPPEQVNPLELSEPSATCTASRPARGSYESSAANARGTGEDGTLVDRLTKVYADGTHALDALELRSLVAPSSGSWGQTALEKRL